MPKVTKKRMTVGAAIILCIVALALNTFWVDSKTRAASPRDGGQIVETGVAPANVKAEGAGPALVLLHGFGAALDWWDDIASDLVTDHRVIRIDISIATRPFAADWRKDSHPGLEYRKTLSPI
jgi:hypothetical protein